MKKSNEELFKDYGCEVIAKIINPHSIEDYFKTTSKHGLDWGMAWLSVSLVSSSGKRYALVRQYEKERSSIIISFKMRDDLSGVSSKLFKKLYIGKISFDRIEGQEAAIVKSNPSKKHNFQIDLNVSTIHWQEDNGDVDLQFESLGPGFSYYIPRGRIDEELYYTEELFRATGIILGESVIGYGSLDQAWMTPGVSWFTSKGFLFFEESWLVWANRYLDGSTDYGLVIGGPDKWNVCFYVDNGQAFTPKNNTIYIQWAEEKYPLKIDVSLDNNKFQFQWNCKHRMLEVKGIALWANGQNLNLVKKDKPIEGYAWSENILFHKIRDKYRIKFGMALLRHLPDSIKSRIYGKMFSLGLKDKGGKHEN